MEAGCRKIADQIKEQLPPGIGMTLFLFEYGRAGAFAYVSTARRDDMVNVVREWLDHVTHQEPAQ